LQHVSPVPFVAEIETPTFLALVTRYLPGTSLASLSDPTDQLRRYRQCSRFLRAISRYVTEEEAAAMQKKSASYHLLTLPMITLASLVNTPEHASLILRGVVRFLTGLPSMRREPITLVHGDLHVKNIILSAGKTYITDFEQTTFTFSMLEPATTLSSIRNSREFLRKLSRSVPCTPQFRTLLAHCSIFNLTSHLPTENRRHYADMLKYAIEE
jgi:Ser/Thr protein kinase RdoA (MazF antagonist)